MNKLNLIFCFGSLFLMGCITENKKIETQKNIVLEEESFEIFLEKFNKDSIFQLSRIDFPMRVHELDYENNLALIEKTIQKKDYKKLDFTIQKNVEYLQKTILKGDEAVIEIRGINNGIYSDIIFKKQAGKWKLKTLIDSST